MTAFHRRPAHWRKVCKRSFKSIRASKSRTALNYKYLYRNKPPWCSIALSGGHRMFMQTVTPLKSPSRHKVKITSVQSPRALSLSQHKALLCLSVSLSLSSTQCTWDISHVWAMGGLFIYSALGQVKWGRWTALVAYSWFSTVDEALFQPSPQKIILLSVLANHRMWANKTIFTDLCTSKTTVRCRAVYLTGIRMWMISE